MDWAFWGTQIKDFILAVAQLVTRDFVPGLISLVLFVLLAALLSVMSLIAFRRRMLLSHAARRIRASGDASGFQNQLHDIQRDIRRGRGSDGRRLAESFEEFRETLIEPARHGEGHVRNSVRPSTFFNLDDLHMGLNGWRIWPSLFVSIGLLCTFLGLIAALAQTQASLEAGGGEQAQMIAALEGLLRTASAKFIMSVTGLFCSIVFTFGYRFWSGQLESSVARLAQDLEKRMDFVSLEALADQQLVAIKEQTVQQQLLNTQLIAELSKPLERMTATGTEAIGGMVNELGQTLSARIGASLDKVAERIDGAAGKLTELSSSLGETSERFRVTLERSASSLDTLVERIEAAALQLANSAESMNAASAPILESARATADQARAMADSARTLIDAAKGAIDAERTVVVASAQSIEELIRNFEARAKAYDGQLEKAFATYVEQVQRTLGELRQHSDGVHDRYADALQVLQAVIENARTFVPESEPPQPRLPA
ncbi:methyl-accepting chemotaxis protein [Reyranella sp.]|uniref:methyl-accepting chemotaxis protein n=1 Tax=Reyranella sp. TaxID=1929291 RepID=UPI003D109C9A